MFLVNIPSNSFYCYETSTNAERKNYQEKQLLPQLGQ